MKGITIWKLRGLLQSCSETHKEIDGKWVPARPLGLDSLHQRLRCACYAFSGKYDLVKWPRNQ